MCHACFHRSLGRLGQMGNPTLIKPALRIDRPDSGSPLSESRRGDCWRTPLPWHSSQASQKELADSVTGRLVTPGSFSASLTSVSQLSRSVFGQDKEAGKPGIEMFVSGEIIENEADHAEQFVPFDGHEREGQSAVGALGFELAQGNRAVPVDVQVLPLVAAKLCEPQRESRVVLEKVDFHAPHFSSETPPRRFSRRARMKRKSDSRLRKTTALASTTSVCARRTTSRSARRQTARAK